MPISSTPAGSGQELAELAVSALASKSAYAGAASMIIGWLVSSNAALFVGMFVGLGGFGINWYYRHKADKRHEAAASAGAAQTYSDTALGYRNEANAHKAAAAGSWVARYYLRVLWIVRNSAYGFAHYFMGFERVGMYNTLILAQRGVWDSDTTNWLYRIDTNKQGRTAFQLRAQLYFTTTRYVRVNLGWKLDWAAERVQIATHINPFRKWQNK